MSDYEAWMLYLTGSAILCIALLFVANFFVYAELHKAESAKVEDMTVTELLHFIGQQSENSLSYKLAARELVKRNLEMKQKPK